ncbi:hypothetical protein BC936DRAFT_143791 [Jimgerdemannia flammicorona]|uniref:Transposase Tc1-like domain-containing protein n=1 Tax=Jimgerdemannia flammicorona TaxID=994334 RepID=A0A433DDI1_9FUNG|nr:hypothetical protein BC936DRAFT_143791 [Jimgerdemannia flammicorona]
MSRNYHVAKLPRRDVLAKLPRREITTSRNYHVAIFKHYIEFPQLLTDAGLPLLHFTTIKREIEALGYHSRIAIHKPLLSDSNIARHLLWASKHHYRSNTKWRTVIFSDESRFNLFESNRERRVLRLHGEKYLDECILHDRVQGGGGGIMVFGWISWHYKSPLFRIDTSITGTLYLVAC